MVWHRQNVALEHSLQNKVKTQDRNKTEEDDLILRVLPPSPFPLLKPLVTGISS